MPLIIIIIIIIIITDKPWVTEQFRRLMADHGTQAEVN